MRRLSDTTLVSAVGFLFEAAEALSLRESKVGRSEGQKVRRSEGRKVGRSEGRKVGSSE